MLDLEQLGALDDDAPPEPDLGRARHRARQLRARHRWAAAAAAVLMLGGAAGAVAAWRGNDHTVQVVGPSGTSENRPTVSGTLPDGLPIVLTLEAPTVVLGEDIRATVVVHNNTDRTKTLGIDPIKCALGVGPALRDARGDYVAIGKQPAACPSVGVNLWAGDSRSFDVVLPTTGVALPRGMREASYSLVLQTGGEFGAMDFTPPFLSIPVRIVMPEALTARLELPQSWDPTGYSVEGTIVFFNGTDAPIDYYIDCHRTPPWEVVLSKDGTFFETPNEAPACHGPSTKAALAPGETRIPFYVGLGYPSCGSTADGPARPACTGDPPGIPDLPPGSYQFVFRGTDAPFASLAVPPIDVDVTARGKSEGFPSFPEIVADNVPAARADFEHLYGAEGSPLGDALRAHGVELVGNHPTRDRLVIQIKPSVDAATEQTIILSLFAHPELVTVEQAPGTPQ